MQKDQGEKSWNTGNGCDVRLVAKILITAIQMNLMPIPSEAGMRQHKFTDYGPLTLNFQLLDHYYLL